MEVEKAPILVAVGDSVEEDASLRFSAAEAMRTGRGLLAAHVVHGNVPVAPHNLLISYETAGEVGHHLVVEAAERLKKLTEQKVEIKTLVPRGGVVDKLVALSRSVHMIVMQHREMSGLRRVFTGSVSSGVAGRASVEVVSVPEQWVAPHQLFSRVVMGVGEWESAAGLVEHAFDLAEQHEAALRVIHASELPLVYDETMVEHGELKRWHDEVTGRIDASLEAARRHHPGVTATVEVQHARPADALFEASHEADLLVVGRRDTAHPVFEHLGSVTRAMLRLSRCPVDIVPRPLS